MQHSGAAAAALLQAQHEHLYQAPKLTPGVPGLPPGGNFAADAYPSPLGAPPHPPSSQSAGALQSPMGPSAGRSESKLT